MGKTYDFSGYATRNDLLCADGRTIRKDAFKNQDGMKVPLVWMHGHGDPTAVLGHALLQNRDDGVYAFCTFNNSEKGQHAKEAVIHGDVRCLSIWANNLKEVSGNVVHGIIREVSLVLAGANPGATIDFVMSHSDDEGDELFANYDESALIIYHSAIEEEKKEKGEQEMADENKQEKDQPSERTIADVFNEMTEEQQKVVCAMVGQVLEDAGAEKTDESEEQEKPEEKEVKHSDDAGNEKDDEEIKHSDLGGDVFMKRNVFDQDAQEMENVLSHDDMVSIIENAKKCGSLREAVLSHSADYGMEKIDILFPDAQTLNGEPDFIKRNDDWVAKVLNGVHHSPFSRVKTVFADITGDDARARGYVKGKLKIEEVFKLLKRVTNPTTVYKKQKLDRDDILDIKDFNVLPWLKNEVRMMLDEELARAYLVGDGRDAVQDADNKIDEECIRPIWKMEDLFTVKAAIPVTASTTSDEKAKAFIKTCIKSRKEYKGSGTPDMFISEDMLTDCLLIEDTTGRVIYDSVQKLASALRVREIIPVPIMEGLTRKDNEENTYELAGIYVNLKDYNVGTDKGGEINFFEDFDIDYNQQKYLMETRCSGTLVKPYSAVAIEFKTAKGD